jgi:radical SAM superfamily enzyme YgiQ (UPF0313 family)
LIVLIIPPVVRKYDDRRLQPLGIAYLAAVLGEAGINCDMVDGNCSVPPSSVESIVSRVIEENYEIVGLSVTTDAFQTAVQIAEEVKRQKQVFVVFGGHHPTAMHKEILSDYDCVDVVVRGEGEISFLQLVRAKQEGRSLAGIQGISYRKAKGLVVVNPDRPPIEDLDSLPFPQRTGLITSYSSFFDTQRSRDLFNVPVISSRGCPHRCVFCAAQSFYALLPSAKRWRPRNPKQVALEIRGIVNMHKDVFIRFVDDNFLVNVGRAVTIAKEIVGQCGKQVSFSFAARADQVVAAGRETIGTLAHHGCNSVELGVENGCDTVLRRLRKDISAKVNEEAIRLTRECGILPGVDYIMFDPWTSLDELKANLQFLKKNALYGYHPPLLYTRVVPFPGTPLAREAEIDMENYFRFPAVARVYAAMDVFKSMWQARIDQLLLALEEAYRSSPARPDFVIDRAILLRKPYRLFEELIGLQPMGAVALSDTQTAGDLEGELLDIERRHFAG